MAKRKRVTMTITVTAPAAMRTSAVWNEVRTRINEITGHYSGNQFEGLSSSDFTKDGAHLRVTVKKITPAKEETTNG